jgi:hypothetical protein
LTGKTVSLHPLDPDKPHSRTIPTCHSTGRHGIAQAL